MKKLLAALLALLLLLAGAYALADDDSDDMRVYNCEDWVSMRAAPDKGSERLAKVILGEVVTDCVPAENGFIRCTYDGIEGYILAEYLADEETVRAATLESFMSMGRELFSNTFGDYTVIARHGYAGSEWLRAVCLDGEGNIVWDHSTSAPGGAMLDQLAAFVTGTDEQPIVVIFNHDMDGRSDYIAQLEASEGRTLQATLPRALTAYDPMTGDILWALTGDETGLGSGLVAATSKDGILYVGGYLGPDPIAIDMDGNIICRTYANDDSIFWLYDIIPDAAGFTAVYESGPDGEMSADNRYEVYYRLFAGEFDPRWPLDAEYNYVTTVNYYNSTKNKRGTYHHSCQASYESGLDVSVHSQPVYAVEDGVVDVSTQAAWTSLGNYVRLKHKVYDKDGNERYVYSLYAHMLDRNTIDENGNSVQLKPGDVVKKGQRIGTSGYSLNRRADGSYSESWHLHFEIFHDDKGGSIFAIYSGDDIEYASSCYSANANHGANDAESQEFVKYMDEHYEKSGSTYRRRADDDGKPVISFVDGLYKEGGGKLISEVVTPEKVESVSE